MERYAVLVSSVFSVKHQDAEIIVPARSTPHEVKYVSDIDDQEGLRFQMPFVMFYRQNPAMEGKDPVKLIRNSLAKALVYYYPFAGRLREGVNRKLMVDCSAQGILFIEADADITLHQLGDSIQPPYPYLGQILHDVPGSSAITGTPLLLVQVTRLICGGFIVAIRLNHVLSDSIGLVQFLFAVVELSRGASEPSQLPVWQREILCARHPPRITCVHHEFKEQLTRTTMNDQATINPHHMVHRSFFFTPTHMANIRNYLPLHLSQRSSNFDVLTAFLWRCQIIAFQLDPNETVIVSCVVNARKSKIVIPDGYYGNSFASPAAISKAELLCKNPLGYAVELIKKAKAQMMTEEYIKSVADLMVIKGRPNYKKVLNYIASDLRGIQFGRIDFGWGKPVYGGPVEATPSITLHTRYTNKKGEDGILVIKKLSATVMERFEHEVKKITQEPMNNGLPQTRISPL